MAGTFVIDYGTALYAVIGTLAALRARERTGVGQRVDVVLLDTAVSFLITAIPEYLMLGKKMTRRGNRDRYAAPVNLYKSKDGQWVYVAAATDSLFPQLLKVMGREEDLQDPRFATLEARMGYIEESEALVANWVGSKTAEEVVELLGGPGLPCAKVATIDEVVVNPQLRHRGMIAEVEHPTAGRVPMQGLHTHFSDTPKQIRYPHRCWDSTTRRCWVAGSGSPRPRWPN
jgi:crotonobetainyl-CoA:carnitine CoA-transferase CaiB-like acyl-CoA transferase